MVWSESLGKALGARGSPHVAVEVGGVIFDNMRPGGMNAAHFFEDIGGKMLDDAVRSGGAELKTTVF